MSNENKSRQVQFQGFKCTVEKQHYANGRPALVLKDARDGDDVAVATVNLPDSPARPNEVFIKNYSENAGMLAALEKAGIVKASGETVRSGFAEIPKAELQGAYREPDPAHRAQFQKKDNPTQER